MRVATAKLLCPIATALLVACDRSGDTAGIDGTGAPTVVARNTLSYGSVSALGSVWVNNERYDTSRAVITIDGRPGTEAEIEQGDIVLVSAKLDPGSQRLVADRVTIDDAVEGPITALDVEASSLVLLGQSVRVTPETLFDDTIPEASLTALALGETIEVAGFRSSNGDVLATRLERKPAGSELETTGPVASLDTTARRFTIGALVIDYSSVTPTPSGIRDGDVVEVKGAALLPGGDLVASSVERRAAVSGDAGTNVELQGYVTSLDAQAPETFQVAGVPARRTNDTVVSGVTIELDAKVGVRGSLDAAGTVVARNVAASRAPQPPSGAYSVMGQLFDSTSGDVLVGRPINLWVQLDRFGYSYWWANGALYSNDRGEFTAINLPVSAISIHAGHYELFQPCAVSAQVPGANYLRVELIRDSAFNTLNGPRPQLVNGDSITGTVFETVNGVRTPVAGAVLWGYRNDVDLASTKTDLQGRFFLCNLPPDAALHVSRAGFPFKWVQLSAISSGAPLEIELVRP